LLELALETERRWQGAPKTRLRVVSVSEEPAAHPLLVCLACCAWTPHSRPPDVLTPTNSEKQGVAIVDLFDCAVCHTRRVWGMRLVLCLV
jgi:hypothetical protein